MEPTRISGMRLITLLLSVDARQGRSWLRRFVKFLVAGRKRIFRGLNLFWREKLLGVQQRPAQGGVVACPRAVETGLALEVSPHGLHFGVEVIEIVEHQG